MSGDVLREGLAQELMRFRWGPGTPSDRHDSRVRQQIALQEADKIRALLAETEPAVEEEPVSRAMIDAFGLGSCFDLDGNLLALCRDAAMTAGWKPPTHVPPSAPSAGVEITEAMVERAARALMQDSARSAGHEPSPVEITGRMNRAVRAEARAALVAALGTEAGA